MVSFIWFEQRWTALRLILRNLQQLSVNSKNNCPRITPPKTQFNINEALRPTIQSFQVKFIPTSILKTFMTTNVLKMYVCDILVVLNCNQQINCHQKLNTQFAYSGGKGPFGTSVWGGDEFPETRPHLSGRKKPKMPSQSLAISIILIYNCIF